MLSTVSTLNLSFSFPPTMSLVAKIFVHVTGEPCHFFFSTSFSSTSSGGKRVGSSSPLGMEASSEGIWVLLASLAEYQSSGTETLSTIPKKRPWLSNRGKHYVFLRLSKKQHSKTNFKSPSIRSGAGRIVSSFFTFCRANITLRFLVVFLASRPFSIT